MCKILWLFFILIVGCVPKSNESTDSYDTSKINKPETMMENRQQNYLHPFKIDIITGSSWSVTIDTVLSNEFNSAKKREYKESTTNSDSLLAVLVRKFPDVIALTDSCCILKGIDRSISLCKKRPKDDKGWKSFRVDGFVNGYLIMIDLAYESGNYLLFDPVTRKYSFMMNDPIFINEEIVYGAGSYYGEGQFEIVNLNEDKYFGLESTWDLRGFYEEEDSTIFLQFEYGDKNKYLRIKY